MKRFALTQKLSLCILFLLLTTALLSQRHVDLLRNQTRPARFTAVQDSVNQYFTNTFRGKGSGYKPWKRWEQWNKFHLNPDGTVGNFAYNSYEAIKATGIMNRTSSTQANTGKWSNIGPVFNQGLNTGVGRPNCIAFHPTNPNIVYVGAPIGGLWKGDKSSGSFVWTPTSDGIAGLGVASVALHPADPNIIYILTGDGNRGDTYSIGMLVSYDGGYSWHETGLAFNRTAQEFGYKLLINPLRPNTMYAAFRNGVYRTFNGGNNWAPISELPGCYDIEFKPGDTTRMYASGFNTLYTLSGGTWSNKSGYLPAGTRRVAIGVTPADAQKVYVYCGNRDSILVGGTFTSSFKGVLRSDDAGATYTLRCNTPNISGYNQDGSDRTREQSDIDMDIAVSPTNAATVYAGAHNVWKSTTSGASFGSLSKSFWSPAAGATNYVHEDINFISINPGDASVYCGSDGGIYRSTDGGTSWTDVSYGLVIGQFYRINVQQSNSNIVVNGSQDGAGNVRVGASSEYKELNGGDGMDCMIDQQDDKVIYTSYNGALFRTLNGGTTVTQINGSLTGNWITPLVMDYYKSDTIYYGQTTFDAANNITSVNVARSFNKGTNWTNIGGGGSEAMALSINNTARLYGYERGNLLTTANANAASPTWVSAMGTNYPNPGILGNAPVTAITVNPTNEQEVWFCMSGYNAGLKVFRSLNAGATWTNMTAGLPNVACLSIVYGSNLGIYAGGVYVGTDIGVFYRNNDLGGWLPFRNWLPAVPVFDLKINYNTNTIRAATYGRGIWESPTYSGCSANITLTTYLEGYHYYQASNTIFSQSVIEFGNGNRVHLKAGNYIQLTPGFNAGNGAFFNATTGACDDGVPTRIADTARPIMRRDTIPSFKKFERQTPFEEKDPKKLPSVFRPDAVKTAKEH